jgi:hypothetical protein
VSLDGLFGATSQAYHAVATANLTVQPLKHPAFPYLIGGAGLYGDAGLPFVFNLGVGADLPVRLGVGGSGEVREHALFVEFRGYQTYDTFTTLSIGVRR